jgi:RNA polymerase sigma-70 factor (ECF subfamily)
MDEEPAPACSETAATLRRDELAETYKTHWEDLVRFAGRRLRAGREDAQDMVQTAFLRLLSRPAGTLVANPAGFIAQTVRHLGIDAFRAARRQGEWDEAAAARHPDDQPGADAHLIHKQRLELLRRAIQELPARQRRAFILSRFHNYSLAEIAADMGIGVEGVKKHLSRALQHCSAALDRTDPEKAP